MVYIYNTYLSQVPTGTKSIKVVTNIRLSCKSSIKTMKTPTNI